MATALTSWRRGVRAQPRYSQGISFLALGLYWAHQFDSAAVWTDSVVQMDPTYYLGRSTAGYVAIERGEYARAVAHFRAAARLTTDVELVNALAGLALAQARGNAVPEARVTLQKAESLATVYDPPPLHTAVYMAQANAALNQPARAVEWLTRFGNRDDLHLQVHLRCDPPFEPLADDPQFRALLLTPRPRKGAGC